MFQNPASVPSEVFAFVPSYNHAPFVEECLRSIIGQSVPPLKLLVIDDGSSDDSPQIIENVLKDCPFDCELIFRANRGLCATLNEGFERSTGKFFAYLGSDDFWLREFIAARVHLIEARPNAILAYGHAYLVDDSGNSFDSTDRYTESWANYPDGNARDMLLKGIAPISSTVMYRRSSLENVRWNEQSRLEDFEMYLNLMNRGEFAFDPQVLSAWRRHDHNTSRNTLMMMAEVISAQTRNIGKLEISESELAERQLQIKFRYAREFLQFGNKREAIGLAKQSWRGRGSSWELVKFAVRLCIPMSVVRMHRRMQKSRISMSTGK